MGNQPITKFSDIETGALIESLVDYSKLSVFQRVEHEMPFHSMKLSTYECRLKKYIYQSERVNLSQLKAAFKNDPKWDAQLNDKKSTLYIFLMAYFKIEETGEGNEIEHHFSFPKLWLLGILLCPATHNEKKAYSFYQILQDDVQETISANDKDIKVNVTRIAEFSTKMILQFMEATKKESTPERTKLEQTLSKVDDEWKENFQEWFQDSIFGMESRVSSELFIKKLGSSEMNWLFSAETVRQKITEFSEKGFPHMKVDSPVSTRSSRSNRSNKSNSLQKKKTKTSRR